MESSLPPSSTTGHALQPCAVPGSTWEIMHAFCFGEFDLSTIVFDNKHQHVFLAQRNHCYIIRL